MARTFGHFRLGIPLAIALVGVVGLDPAISAAPDPNAGAGIGTPLPPGWEACVLEGVGAPVTQVDIADLDEWQVVEGGSTNNTAAYNPFNARQVTDSNGVPIPAVISSDGFPAFATWANGCSATVAALLQPSMAPIVTALKAGGVAVPGVFLFAVDQSPWCAPSADGIPCYANEILAGEIVQVLLKGGSGQLKGSLTSYSDTGVNLRSYEEDASVTASDQGILATKNAQLTLSDHEVSVEQGLLAEATLSLRRLALDDYTNDAASRFESSLPMLGSPDERDTIGQYFRDIAASHLTDNYERAQTAVKNAVSTRQAAEASVAQATLLMDAAQAAENQALAVLESDAKGIESGLACTAAPTSTAPVSPVGTQMTIGQLWQALQDCLAPPLS